MKIKKISLQGYKKFIQHTEFSFFIDENESNHKTLIVGNNGSGKTSILQAIVLIIASATRENFTFENFDWLGYEFRHLQSGKIPLKIEIEVVFDENEVNQTKNFANKLKELGVKLGETPGSDRYVTLCIDYHKMKVVAKGGTKSYYQFSGYQYAKRLSALTINKNQLFEYC